jgi:hypothetical protein
VAAPIGAGLQTVGSGWPLYGACVIFIGGTVLAFTLPRKVDSAKGERRAQLVEHHGHQPSVLTKPSKAGGKRANGRKTTTRSGEKGKRPGLRTVGPSVLHGLQANAAHRALSGFLIFFLAFLLREQPLAGQSAAVSLGIVGVAAGVGNALGTAMGSWLRTRGPEVIIAGVLGLALGVAVLAAVFFSTLMVAALSAMAGFTQALSKLSLDAMIQRDVPEEVRTSAFARSETLLQMSWVVGGGIGISLPLNGVLGMSVAAAILALGAAASVRGLLSAARRGSPHPRVA